MPSYKVAHIRERAQDMIIFPLESSFANRPQSSQEQELLALERRANSAGLRGSAVAVWNAGGGRMGFLGPRPWHTYLRALGVSTVLANLNQEISW